MAKVTIYTTAFCPYCLRAKRLLMEKNASFEEIDVTFNPAGRASMMERSGGRRSVPQIFVNETHIGGCAELFALDAGGKLDPLLNGS